MAATERDPWLVDPDPPYWLQEQSSHTSHGSDSLPATQNAVSHRYVSWLVRFNCRLRFALFLLLVLGAVLAPRSFGNMTTDIPAAEGTYSYRAKQMFNQHFPGKRDEVVAAIVVRRFDEGPVLDDVQGSLLGNLTHHILERLKELDSTNLVAQVDCWHCYEGIPEMQDGFISPDGKVAIVAVTYNIDNDQGRVLPVIRAALASAHQSVKAELEVSLTGTGPVNEAAIDGVINNLESMDSIAFPAALILLGMVLKSVRLMLLPVLAIISAIVLSFGVLMYPVSCAMHIFILAGSLMMSLIIAMSIDYCLFVLSRFQAELQALPNTIRAQERTAIALTKTLDTAGHTVLVSGATLILSFLGLLIARDNFMTSIAVTSAIAIVSAMFSALVMVPALLLGHPRFFVGEPMRALCGFHTSATKQDAARTIELVAEVRCSDGGELTRHCEEGVANHDPIEKLANALSSTPWFKFSMWTLSHKKLISAIVFAAFLVPLLRLPSMRLSRSPLLCVPRGNDAFEGFNQIDHSFGAGMLWPTKVLVVPSDGQTVLSSQFFDRVSDTLENVTKNLPRPPGSQIRSVVYTSQTGRIPFFMVQAALDDSNSTGSWTVCNLPSLAGSRICKLLRLARQRFVNADASAMVLHLSMEGDAVTGDPWGQQGTEWTRAVIDAFKAAGPDQYYVSSNPASVLDTQDGIYASAFVVVAATAVMVFGVVSLSFHSVVIPLRLLPSIGLTILWTYGLAVLVYQDGILDWLGMSALAPVPGGIEPGIAWILPALCFTILSGLCLDYDIFVLNSVAEFRMAGFTDRDSVALGVSATGHTINVAGCIMAIAFSGLLMSSQLLLNQLSFFLVTCVLIDTFVVRSIVVPICMDILGSLSNWWPRQMPTPTRKLDLQVEVFRGNA